MREENRIGKFYLDHAMIHFEPEKAMTILSRMLVVKAEMLFYRDEVEYYAYSWLFEPRRKGDMAPTYRFEVNGTIVEAIKED